jgi:intracellular sulfur oxidation DsrE/DsrF family protein
MKYACLFVCSFCFPCFAQDAIFPPSFNPIENLFSDKDSELVAPGYLVKIDEPTPSGLERALLRAEMFFLDGGLKGTLPPASFVVHGPEVSVFFKDNYAEHKSLVDLAARLTAFGVVDIQVCETRTGILGRNKSALMPFVGTVPFGPAEENRLLQQEGYVSF